MAEMGIAIQTGETVGVKQPTKVRTDHYSETNLCIISKIKAVARTTVYLSRFKIYS